MEPSVSGGQLPDAIKDAAAPDDSTASIGAMKAPRYPPPRPIDPSRKTFLDLPGELRNEIYALLLPDIGFDRLFTDDPRRKDGSRACTAFMASCLQVRDEALDIIDGWVKDAGPVVVRLGEWSLDDAGPVVFSIGYYNFSNNPSRLPFIKHARRLRLMVSTVAHGGDLGHVQDSLFSLLRHLQGEHNLQELQVQIKVYGLERHELEIFALTGNHDLLRGEHDLMARLRMEARECSRDRSKPCRIESAYIAAFCLDTMRCINGIEPMQQEGRLAVEVLDYELESIHSWTKIPHLQLLGPEDPRHGDYLEFGAYSESVRAFGRVLADRFWWNLKGGNDLSKAYHRWSSGIESSRVRGDVTALRQYHQAAMECLEREVPPRYQWEGYHRYLREVSDKLPAQDMKITRFGDLSAL